jgi:hypothetical protein
MTLVARARALAPRGPAHLVGQLAVLVAVDATYEVTRALIAGSRATALAHAHSLIDLERALGIFHERAIQRHAASAPGVVMDVAKLTYQNCQRLFTWSFVLFVYLRRHAAYPALRNTIIVLDLIGLIGYAVYPTAPPRLTPGYGFVDTLDPTQAHLNSSLLGSLTNLYAAVPSLHTAYALLIGFVGFRVSRTQAGRVAACVYPVLVVWATVATANHWLLDAVAGAAALGLAALILDLPRRVRPPRG